MVDRKIENFIRTKYDSKRWVMEGGIPDPATLGDSDDDDTVAGSRFCVYYYDITNVCVFSCSHYE